jgi:hypothetical protein
LREVQRLGVLCFGGRYIDHLWERGVKTVEITRKVMEKDHQIICKGREELGSPIHRHGL